MALAALISFWIFLLVGIMPLLVTCFKKKVKPLCQASQIKKDSAMKTPKPDSKKEEKAPDKKISSRNGEKSATPQVEPKSAELIRKAPEDTQQSGSVRTELFENAQCNPIGIDLKKVFHGGTKSTESRMSQVTDTDSDDTLAALDSDFDDFILIKLENFCHREEKKRTSKRPREEAPRSGRKEQSLETQSD